MQKGVIPFPFRSHSECRKGEAKCQVLQVGVRNDIWPVKLYTKSLILRGLLANPGLPGKRQHVFIFGSFLLFSN